MQLQHEHNHITRDIKPKGECPACDVHHSRQSFSSGYVYRKAPYIWEAVFLFYELPISYHGRTKKKAVKHLMNALEKSTLPPARIGAFRKELIEAGLL